MPEDNRLIRSQVHSPEFNAAIIDFNLNRIVYDSREHSLDSLDASPLIVLIPKNKTPSRKAGCFVGIQRIEKIRRRFR